MIHLQKFIERVHSHDIRGQKDFIMSMHDAKAMHVELTSLLLALESTREAHVAVNTSTEGSVQIRGGSFK